MNDDRASDDRTEAWTEVHACGGWKPAWVDGMCATRAGQATQGEREDRLALLEERTPNQNEGSQAGKEKFPPDLRNEVAIRGLIGETRAYERGGYTFSVSKASDTLTDEQNRPWRITEEALVGPDEERLPRLGGHLAYWFGWFAFFPKTEVFEAP